MQQSRRRLRRTRKATPPTVPPAIAPTLVVLLFAAVELPPADAPPTPATLVAAADVEAEAEAELELELVEVVVELEVDVLELDVVAEEGEEELIQLVPPDCMVRRLVEPPVWNGPESAIRRRNCVPEAMSTVQSYELVPAFWEIGRENAVPAGMIPYKSSGRVALASHVMVMEEQDEGLVVGDVEKKKS